MSSNSHVLLLPNGRTALTGLHYNLPDGFDRIMYMSLQRNVAINEFKSYKLAIKASTTFPSPYNSSSLFIDPSPVIEDSWLYCLNYVQVDSKGYSAWYKSKLKLTSEPRIPISFAASSQMVPNIASGVCLDYPHDAPPIDETGRLCYNLVLSDKRMSQLIRNLLPGNKGLAFGGDEVGADFSIPKFPLTTKEPEMKSSGTKALPSLLFLIFIQFRAFF